MRNKQVVRLTESQLHSIIAESVKSVLKESYHWWGDTSPLETIISACDKIYDNFKCYNDEDYEFDPEESTAGYDLFEWAKKVRSEAEEFYRYNANNIGVGEGDLASY